VNAQRIGKCHCAYNAAKLFLAFLNLLRSISLIQFRCIICSIRLSRFSVARFLVSFLGLEVYVFLENHLGFNLGLNLFLGFNLDVVVDLDSEVGVSRSSWFLVVSGFWYWFLCKYFND
jgi:hypothetical protein